MTALFHTNDNIIYYGLVVALAHNYVRMKRKQDGGSNQCFSIYMATLSPENI